MSKHTITGWITFKPGYREGVDSAESKAYAVASDQYHTAARNSLMAAHYPEHLEAERAARPAIPMKREALKARINTLEAIMDLKSAISDVTADAQGGCLLKVDISAKSLIAFATHLPPAVVLAGLRAMQAELERQL